MRPLFLIMIFPILLFVACSKSSVEPGDESNLEKAQVFGVYLLQNDSLIYKANNEIDADKIMIIEQPLITLDDIDHYDYSSQTLHLRKAIGWKNIPVHNAPFIVAEKGELLQYGHFYFWPNCCWPRGPANLTVYNHSILKFTFQIHGLQAQKIIDALPADFKQNDVTVELLDAEFTEEMNEIVSANIRLKIKNNLNYPAYFIDPDKVPKYALESFIYIGDEEIDWVYDYNLQDTLPDNPDGTSEWSIDWYTLVAPNDSLIRTMQVEPWNRATNRVGHESKIIFTLDNMAGTVPIEIFENLDHPVWIGKIIHKQTVVF